MNFNLHNQDLVNRSAGFDNSNISVSSVNAYKLINNIIYMK